MKTITIRDDIYKSLRNLKRDGESFSDVIERLLGRKSSNIESYFGILEDSEAMEDIDRITEKIRESARSRG